MRYLVFLVFMGVCEFSYSSTLEALLKDCERCFSGVGVADTVSRARQLARKEFCFSVEANISSESKTFQRHELASNESRVSELYTSSTSVKSDCVVLGRYGEEEVIQEEGQWIVLFKMTHEDYASALMSRRVLIEYVKGGAPLEIVSSIKKWLKSQKYILATQQASKKLLIDYTISEGAGMMPGTKVFKGKLSLQLSDQEDQELLFVQSLNTKGFISHYAEQAEAQIHADLIGQLNTLTQSN